MLEVQALTILFSENINDEISRLFVLLHATLNINGSYLSFEIFPHPTSSVLHPTERAVERSELARTVHSDVCRHFR